LKSKNSPRILICSDSFKNITGLSYVALNLCNFFIQKEYLVNYCILSGEDCTINDLPNKGHFFYENLFDSKIYNCQNKKQDSLTILNDCIKEFKPNIVLTIHDLWQFENIILSAYRDTFTWIAYCPIESDFYSEYVINPTQIDPNIRKSLSDICKNIDYAIAYNEVGKIQLNKFGANTLESLPNGLDNFYFEEEELTKQLVFRGAIKEDDFVFITVGHNFNRKGLDFVIEAFYKFLQKVDNKEKYKLYLHGMVDTVDAGTDIKSMIYELKISDNIILSKPEQISKRELYKRYRCCNCYIGLPLAEGFGYGFMEAMINGLPIIYHNVGGISQYIQDFGFPISSVATIRPNNYFCDWKIPNINETVEKMLEVIQLNLTELDIIKKRNQEEGQKYLWENVYTQLETILDFNIINKIDIFNKLSIKRTA
jgi:glycosyltransferase involved in cell wall biosynthesis